MPTIEVRNISKKFEDSIAIEDISFTLNDGELLTLLGPSGSGKTTVLRLIAGLILQDTGQIFFDSEDISDVKTEDRNIGFVFQSYALFPHLTVIENIAFGLETRKWSKAEKITRVKELLKIVDLEGKGKRYPRELSGGEQSRVALARAIAPNPSLLLLDEPLSALDVTLKENLRKTIRKIQQETAISTIYVTHDQREAMEISDTIIILNQGKIVEEGTSKELYLNPKSSFTAKFLGITNVFKGTVKQTSKNTIISTNFGELEFKDQTRSIKGDISFAIYPEHIQISKKQATSRNKFEAIVTKVLFGGSTIELILKIQDTLLEARLTSTKENQDLVENEQVYVSIPTTAVHILEK